MRIYDPRRGARRVTVHGLCGMVVGRALLPASMVDLSWRGLRLELPFDPATATRTFQLEIELPCVDDIMWATGHVTFAHLSAMGGRHANGQPRLWCSAGIALDVAASRDRGLLRDYVESYG